MVRGWSYLSTRSIPCSPCPSRQESSSRLFATTRDEDRAALMELYRQVCSRHPVSDDKAVRLVTVLRLSGIVRSEGGSLRVRNRISVQVFDGAWIVAHMPGAELRRQRAAFR